MPDFIKSDKHQDYSVARLLHRQIDIVNLAKKLKIAENNTTEHQAIQRIYKQKDLVGNDEKEFDEDLPEI